jgi:hypothetical protein
MVAQLTSRGTVNALKMVPSTPGIFIMVRTIFASLLLLSISLVASSKTPLLAIGENREGDESKPVTTSDDVGAFVGVHIRQLFDEAGIKMVDSNGAVTVTGEVKKFFVREGNTYKSEVAVQLTVTDPEGKTLWKGLASGEATRFGRSYKVENYYEVLSDAVVNTVSSMLQAAEFQRALSGHAIASGT